MSIFVLSDSVAARRRFYLYLVDATDGITPETGEAAGQPQVSKAGGAWANTSATLTAVGNGTYYVELTTSELATLGSLGIRYKSANTAEFFGNGVVVNSDVMTTPAVNVTLWKSVGVNDAGGGSGGDIPAYLPSGAIAASSFAANAVNAAALATDAVDEIVDAVWNEARSGHVTAGTFGEGVATVQGNVTGSVASVTGSIGSVATGGITAGSIATDAIGAAELAADAIAEIAAAVPSASAIADAVWDEAISGHVAVGSTGATLFNVPGTTVSGIADAVWDEVLADHLVAGSTGAALNTAAGTPGLTAASVADAVWDELAVDHVIDGSMGEHLQDLADAVLIWPTPVGGGITAATLIQRAEAIADMHDNFVSETEWLRWLNQEQYALQLFLVRNGWTLPFDTTAATITSTGWSLVTNGAAAVAVAKNAGGHYVFTPTLADVMALVCIHESVNGSLRRLNFNNDVDFLRQTNGSTLVTAHATDYRARMYGNEIHLDMYPTPAAGEVYLITYLSAPVALTTTAQAIALPMGWEERVVLGMARRALIKEESDPRPIEGLMREMDSQIEQLCWNRVMSESPKVRNSDARAVALPKWQEWYWR